MLEKSDGISLAAQNANIILLLCGAICFFAYYAFRVLLWQKILELQQHKVSLKTAAFLWSSSEIKRFVPGNIWSFASRIQQFSEKQISKKEVVFALIEEAKMLVFGSALVSVFSFSFIFYNFFHTGMADIFLRIAYTIVGAGSALYLYKYPKHILLFALSCTSFFFFGLGTYLTIASIVPLSPYFLLTFISLFCFSYLAGYASLITPMGLGVRETVITYGLSYFIPFTISGLASIFARLAIIVVEIIFFFASLFFYKKTQHFITITIKELIQKHWQKMVLLGAIIFYILYFSSASIERFNNFYTGRFDLGNMDQVVWNTMKGRIFQFTDPDGTNIVSRLAFHADFFLIFLAPLYMLWADPRMLLITQTIVLGCGAIFVYQIANRIFSEKNMGLLFALLFLVNPHVQYTNLYDFHVVTFATTFLLGAFYFLQKRNYIFFIIFSLLAGLTKENVWLVTGLLGIYFFLKEKKTWMGRITGALFMIFSFSIFYYLVWYAIPHARGSQHFALSYYADFGTTPTAIIKTVIFSPQKIFGVLLQKDRLEYVTQLLLPTGFTALFAPLYFIFALPDLVINLLSNNSQLRQIYYHYTAVITPFLFIASMYGTKRIQSLFPQIKKIIPLYLLITTIIAMYQLGPLPGSQDPDIAMFTTPLPNKEIIATYLDSIKKHFSVAATNNLGSHLSRRQKVFTIPIGMDQADVIVFLLNDPFAQPSLAAQKQMVEKLKKDKNYIMLFEKGDFVAFEKVKQVY